MGIASSEVEINTAIKVPAPITPPLYRVVQAAENPHWGTQPRAAPPKGPSGPSRASSRVICPLARCSRNSISRYAPKRKGRVFRESMTASVSMSSIMRFISFWV